MNLTNLVSTLDNTLNRKIVQYKNKYDIIAYDCNNTAVTVNNTQYNPRRLFLIPEDDVILGLYINTTVTEIPINDINTITLQ